MSEYQDPIQVSTTGTPRWVAIAVAVLAGTSVLGLGIGWSALNHANGVAQATQSSLRQANDALNQKLAREDEINQQLQSDLKVVTDKLNVTQTDLQKARKQGKLSSADVNKKLAGLQESVNTQLAAKANAEDLNKLNTDVTGVRTDLDATKNSLQMARSEMGTLIARNHDEIDELRRIGTRDYFEFTVNRKGGAQKIGVVQVELKNTNPKRNQFTINVLADDKSFEKKNRSVNEPIFFYTGTSHSALELVINKVTKSSASGYLSAPKGAVTTPAASASTSGN
jgi:hypothetical protein